LPLLPRRRWQLWGLYVIAWTVALLYPIVPDIGLEGTEELLTVRAVIGKTAHVSAYAVMAVLTGWLRAPTRYRWLLVFFVMAHATATEMGQWVMNEQLGWSIRTGDLRDVAYDNVGILMGLLLSWKWWTQRSDD
jgi:hypothetical protein